MMKSSPTFKRLQAFSQEQIPSLLRMIFTLSLGAVIVAIGFSMFQVPFNLAAGGITGIAIIIRKFVDLPTGLLFLLLNIPMMFIGFYFLGRWRFLTRTIFAVLIFSFTTDFIAYIVPKLLDTYPLTPDMLLGSIYAGVITGIGSGLIYRAGGTIGGTSIISRIIQRKTGIPLSQVYLAVDGSIILGAAFIFSWDIALHAILVLMIAGVASDFALEGPSVVRTASIVTDQPQEMVDALMRRLRRGVSHWEITGGYTGQKRAMIFCTLNRAQIFELKEVVYDVNPDAFVVIGVAQQAMGTGFHRFKGRKKTARGSEEINGN